MNLEILARTARLTGFGETAKARPPVPGCGSCDALEDDCARLNRECDELDTLERQRRETIVALELENAKLRKVIEALASRPLRKGQAGPMVPESLADVLERKALRSVAARADATLEDDLEAMANAVALGDDPLGLRKKVG